MYWRGCSTKGLDRLEFTAMLVMMLINLIRTPFTKVEESFNIQAVFDLIYKDWFYVSKFDHVEFPGVVPRTFIGPIILSTVPRLMIFLFHISQYTALLVARGTLGFFIVLSLYAIRTSLSWRFGRLSAIIFTVSTLSQFHLMFYASRTLPNVFALILMNFAFADRVRPAPFSQPYRSIVIMSIACALFRSELCLYIFSTLIVDLYCKNIEIGRTITYGLSAAVGTALTSILVDSYFWRRLCYPELEVFYFNVVLNKSSDWGTLPFHWYFTNAIPRALGANLGGLFYSVFVPGARAPLVLALPAFLFVGLYSFLPHKELRFIFYVIPVLNMLVAYVVPYVVKEVFQPHPTHHHKKDDDTSYETTASHGALRLERKRKLQRLIHRTACICIMLSVIVGILVSCVQTLVSWQASYLNYPSAKAMQRLHSLENAMYRGKLPQWSTAAHGGDDMNQRIHCEEDPRTSALVHIDARSAMNGISQFLQSSDDGSCPRWRYSKREDIGNIDWTEFTHLISEKDHVEGFCLIHIESSFAGIDWQKAKIRLKAHTFVHRNMNISLASCQTTDGSGSKERPPRTTR